ncbi:MAG: NAD(P)-binding domain-containing protein [Bacteroidales bacterium]|nr:NAD(P)-binding domain-containing protein [Bacteroidales bacterium]
MKTIAIMGTGSVGQAYASKFITLGYDVMLGTRNVSREIGRYCQGWLWGSPFSEWHSANKAVKLGTFAESGTPLVK